jgi:hypothetical protein
MCSLVMYAFHLVHHDAMLRLASIVLHDDSEVEPDVVAETFSYELDEYGNPVRMISSKGPAATPTTEVFDAEGHHLFQLVYDAEGEPSEVRLYRDNRDPVRSLMLAAAPPYTSTNLWGSAAFEGEGSVVRYVPGSIYPPDRLMPWQPLTLAPDESANFSVDVDGDDQVDVAGDFTFDEQARLSRFALELAGAPRLTVELTYDPGVITQIATSLPSQERYEARYYYGCDDFELPAQPR